MKARLLDLGFHLSVDGLERVVDRATLGDCRNLRGNSCVDFVRVDAVIDCRNLGQPIGKALPDLLATEEGIRLFIGSARAGRRQRADRTAIRQDLLVEVDVLGIFRIEEVDCFILLRRGSQNIPAGTAEVGGMRCAVDGEGRDRSDAPFAGLSRLRLDGAGDPDAGYRRCNIARREGADIVVPADGLLCYSDRKSVV